MSEVVLFEEIQTPSGYKLGVATLNSEKSLNALSLDMIQQLQPQLDMWAAAADIAAVFLQGAGEKAFCAGGDIVAMYRAMAAKPGVLVDEVADFFSQEYRLDYTIQTFPKPFIIWGHGIVMGGGMGLMNGGSHRIVTERSLLAMPEITIGLYPDVGATHFLNKMPAGCGLFLGMTGAHINATDALFLELADHFVSSSQKSEVIESLTRLPWSDSATTNHAAVSTLLSSLTPASEQQPPMGQVEAHLDVIQQVTVGAEAADVVAAIIQEPIEDAWFNRAQKTLAAGCPMTAHIVFNQLQHGADLSLADCFRMELTLSVQCCTRGDFREGIRALLIDKDKQPQWQHQSVADVDAEEVDAFFTSPWTATEHPLRDL